MNISPSDMDVRQGSSLAPRPATYQANEALSKADETQRTTAQTSAQTQANPLQGQEQDATDLRSQSISAAADKTAAREAAQKLEEQLQATDTKLKIRVLDDSQNRVQVEIVDQTSNKVLRKIPQDEVLKLAASIKEMSGFLLNNPA